MNAKNEEVLDTERDLTVAVAAGRRWTYILVAGLLIVLVPAAAFVALVYVTFLRPPAGAPGEFLEEGRRTGTRTLVVNAGDSLTHASASGDYVAILRGRFVRDGYGFVNAGANGDTSHDLLGRIDEIAACRPDAVTVLIGTNDARDEPSETAAMEKFRNNLEEILAHLRTETDARVAELSLPPVGEDLDTEINRWVARYNAVIGEVATEQGATYLPLHEELSAVIREDRSMYRSARGFSFRTLLWSAFLH